MSTAKDLANLARKISASPEIKANVDLLTDMQSLHGMISDLREVTIDQREEIENLKKQISGLRSKLEIQESMEEKNGMLIRKGIHYCFDCWTNEKKLRTLSQLSYGGWECHVCHATYRSDEDGPGLRSI